MSDATSRVGTVLISLPLCIYNEIIQRDIVEFVRRLHLMCKDIYIVWETIEIFVTDKDHFYTEFKTC